MPASPHPIHTVKTRALDQHRKSDADPKSHRPSAAFWISIQHYRKQNQQPDAQQAGCDPDAAGIGRKTEDDRSENARHQQDGGENRTDNRVGDKPPVANFVARRKIIQRQWRLIRLIAHTPTSSAAPLTLSCTFRSLSSPRSFSSR